MKDIKSFTVKSLANGNMLIEIKYKKGLPGVMTRMYIARKIQEIMKKKLTEPSFIRRCTQDRLHPVR